MQSTRKYHPVARHRLAAGLGLGLALALSGTAITASAAGGATTPAAPSAPDDPTGFYSYLWLPGSTFHAFGDGADYQYSNGGCITALPGATETRMVHKVVLPAGATVKFVRLYTYDDSSAYATSFFTTYDATGGYDQINVVSSTDHGGYGSDLGAEMTYVVDPLVEPINLAINLREGGPSSDTIFANGFEGVERLSFCAVRIAYLAP